MKYLLFVAIFIGTFCQAQTTLPEFAPHGAHWTNVVVSGYGQYPSYQLQYWDIANYDTVVEGKTCRIFLFNGVEEYFAYRDSLQIWVHVNNLAAHWQLQYDFGWQAGQQVTTNALGIYFAYTPTTSVFDTLNATIVASGDTVINGFSLPFFKFYNFRLFSDQTVIMNIGCTSNSFIPTFASTSESTPPLLRCYRDSVIGQVKAPSVVDCDSVPKVNVPLIATWPVELYPNPANDDVHFAGTISAIASVDILSIDGRRIGTNLMAAQTLSLRGLEAGTYAVVLHMKDGSVHTQRLVVQR